VQIVVLPKAGEDRVFEIEFGHSLVIAENVAVARSRCFLRTLKG
jgi:hypothetical protein